MPGLLALRTEEMSWWPGRSASASRRSMSPWLAPTPPGSGIELAGPPRSSAPRRRAPWWVASTPKCPDQAALTSSWSSTKTTALLTPVIMAGSLRSAARCRPRRHRQAGAVQWRARSSAHRLFHERGDPCLVGGGQLRQREGDRPHGAVVEVRHVVEAERRVPGLELLRGLEEADDLAVLGVRGHPVPGSRRERWRAGFDEGMQPLGYGAVRFGHLGDLREHVAFPVRLGRAPAAARGRLQLLAVLFHRGPFLVGESLGHHAGGVAGGLLRVLH